jgi:hypothetical protein
MLANLEQANTGAWLNVLEGGLTPELTGLLRSLAATEIPATDEAGQVRFAKGVMARALDNALAREKSNLMAQLRRAADDPQSSTEVQRKLVELESRRRKLRE